MKLILLNNFLFILRIGVRLLDNEDTYESLGNGEWSYLVTGGAQNIMMAITLNFCSVLFSKWQIMLFLFYGFFHLTVMLTSCAMMDDKVKNKFWQNVSLSIPGIAIYAGFFFFMNKINLKLLYEMFHKVEN